MRKAGNRRHPVLKPGACGPITLTAASPPSLLENMLPSPSVIMANDLTGIQKSRYRNPYTPCIPPHIPERQTVWQASGPYTQNPPPSAPIWRRTGRTARPLGLFVSVGLYLSRKILLHFPSYHATLNTGNEFKSNSHSKAVRPFCNRTIGIRIKRRFRLIELLARREPLSHGK